MEALQKIEKLERENEELAGKLKREEGKIESVKEVEEPLKEKELGKRE